MPSDRARLRQPKPNAEERERLQLLELWPVGAPFASRRLELGKLARVRSSAPVETPAES
jgi:hypothetical protein